MTISFTVSVGYQRTRPETADRFEARMDSLGLILVGGGVVALIVWIALPHVLQWVTSLT
jgi:hypothetical protein